MTDIEQYIINIIQGDSQDIVVTIKDKNKQKLTTSEISDVFFSCKDLNYQTVGTYNYDMEAWTFEISAKETIHFRPIATNYDITVVFAGGKIKTVVYKSRLIIKPKTNDIEV